jgi:hypothetical protein
MINSTSMARQLRMLIFACVLAGSPVLADSLSPKETYLKYRATLAAADKVEAIQPMCCKKVNEEIDQTPADMKPKMFEFIKATAPLSVEVLSEAVDGDTATLNLSGKTEPAASNVSERTLGKVTLVKEDGMWKIGKESWNSKVEVH